MCVCVCFFQNLKIIRNHEQKPTNPPVRNKTITNKTICFFFPVLAEQNIANHSTRVNLDFLAAWLMPKYKSQKKQYQTRTEMLKFHKKSGKHQDFVELHNCQLFQWWTSSADTCWWWWLWRWRWWRCYWCCLSSIALSVIFFRPWWWCGFVVLKFPAHFFANTSGISLKCTPIAINRITWH